ncbi:MAG: DNA polymerase I, partial [Alphaproteobacteria bacterium]|nr:DNA polymerase I [Alphaproteobacteria bacterium]
MSADPALNTESSSAPRKKELYLLDASGFIFRAYFAMAYKRGGPTMTNPAGVPVGAVYGFTNMLLKLLKDYHAPYLAVVFDSARHNFRNDIYPAYKANRDETPEELIPQFPLVRDATRAFDLPALELPGYEADDLIAAYARLAREQGIDVVIVSSDKDLMQLVGEGVRLLDPVKQIFMGEKEVLEKFGVRPDRVVDVQALAGDSTDNVPGVPGIGIKTAAELINEFGDLETLLSRAGEIKQTKRRESLIEHAEMARISKRLVRLDDRAPIPVPLEDLKTHDPDKPALTAFLQEHGFNSIIKRLNGASTDSGLLPAPLRGFGGQSRRDDGKNQDDNQKENAVSPETSPSENIYTLITDEEILKLWIAEAYETGFLAIDTETTSLTPARADLVGISMSSVTGKGAYIPVGHTKPAGDLFQTEAAQSENDIKQLPKDRVVALLKPVLEDPSVLKIGHNIKYDWQIFAKEGITLSPCDDTMLLSYALDGAAHSHSMDNLSLLHLGHQPITYEEVAGKGKSQVRFDHVPIEKALTYAAEDAEITLRLHRVLKPRLAREKMTVVYEMIERPLIPVIARMELEGIKVDPAVLRSMSADFGTKLTALELEIHKLAGHEFNVASPRQVGAVLFAEMGLKGGRKTGGGEWSTAVDVLEDLAAQGHEIVVKILEHRQLSKLKSTYTDALQIQIDPRTGRVHSSFAMAHTNTGRLSSSDPNLQNIPIRTEEGRKIREAFVPR